MPENEERTIRTTCCVVGGGPAGVMLSMLLARSGVEVMLLEAHDDFDRDFRGDPLHPSTMEYFDQLGLTQKLAALPHAKVRHADVIANGTTLRLGDFSLLKTPYPYVTIISQSDMLASLLEEACRMSSFTVLMNARVRGIIEKSGKVCGVTYQKGQQEVSVHADLTVACDGRFSAV